MSDTAAVVMPAGVDEDAGPPPGAPRLTAAARARDLAARSGRTWVHPFALFAASRVVVIVSTAVAALLDPTRSFLQIANAWDSEFYLDIARTGYPTTVPNAPGDNAKLVTAFFPGYSIVLKAVHEVTGWTWRYSGFTVSYVFGLTAAILLWFLVRDLRGAVVADRGVALFCFFPGSFVLSMTYSESMFIALAVGCLWALTRRQWLIAGLLAAAATGTRSNGLALCAACAFSSGMAIYQRREWRSLIAPVLSPVGMLAFFAYLWRHTGDARVWFKVQKYGWQQNFDPGIFPHTVRLFFHHMTRDVNVLVIMISSAFLLWLLCFVARSRLPATLYVYAGVVVGMTLYAYNLEPKPRFVLTAFPFLLAPVERMRPITFQILLWMMAGGLAVLTALSLGGIYVTP